jgi:hypothetical protein
VRENRLRRMAQRQGYVLRKSRRRDPRALEYDGYMLVEPSRNVPVLGYTPHAFSATLDDVETFLTSE